MAVVFLSLRPFPARATDNDSRNDLELLKELSIEDLMRLEVTSVSRQAQSLQSAPAAVFVITAEDLRRCGATSIAEALRLAPGIQVARIDNNKWAVSARGFNGRFANKLLVLKDGRRLYNSGFSGVFWELQDTVLDNIERIEVIRGPGAALWGSNAVNGVINIITRTAAQTTGGLVTLLTGSNGQGIAEFRYGDELDELGAWRVSGKGRRESDGETENLGSGNDAWEIGRMDYRLDLSPVQSSRITVQGDVYTGQTEQAIILPSGTSPTLSERVDEEVDKRGGNILLRLEHDFKNRSTIAIQAYYDSIEHEETINDFKQDTLDLDLQYEFSPATRHNIICGAEGRFTRTEVNDTEYVSWQKNDDTEFLLSTFIQDRIDLIPDDLSLTLGTKLEFNEISGCEIQPNIRLLLNVTPTSSIWVAASRASRMPSAGERGATYLVAYLKTGLPTPPIVPMYVSGNDDLDPERVDAFEAGFRSSLTPNFSVDLTGFYNKYENLIVDKLTYTATGIPDMSLDNGMSAKTYGAELSSSYRIMPTWKVTGTFSVLQMDLKLEDDSYEPTIYPGDSPQHQASLFSSMDLPHNLELDLWLRYVDTLSSQSVDSYTTMDARLSWQGWRNLTLSLVGQNLFEPAHMEFNSEYLNMLSTEVERSVYGKVEWKF